MVALLLARALAGSHQLALEHREDALADVRLDHGNNLAGANGHVVAVGQRNRGLGVVDVADRDECRVANVLVPHTVWVERGKVESGDRVVSHAGNGLEHERALQVAAHLGRRRHEQAILATATVHLGKDLDLLAAGQQVEHRRVGDGRHAEQIDDNVGVPHQCQRQHAVLAAVVGQSEPAVAPGVPAGRGPTVGPAGHGLAMPGLALPLNVLGDGLAPVELELADQRRVLVGHHLDEQPGHPVARLSLSQDGLVGPAAGVEGDESIVHRVLVFIVEQLGRHVLERVAGELVLGPDLVHHVDRQPAGRAGQPDGIVAEGGAAQLLFLEPALLPEQPAEVEQPLGPDQLGPPPHVHPVKSVNVVAGNQVDVELN